jgi:hypothetical protein
MERPVIECESVKVRKGKNPCGGSGASTARLTTITVPCRDTGLPTVTSRHRPT